MKRVLSDLLNWLNGIGSIVLAYALLNPTAGSDLIALLPDKLKTPVALMVPTLWFGVVQYGKMRALKKAGDAAP